MWMVDIPDSWFQSAPPARRATRRGAVLDRERVVSIRAPRAEGDSRPGAGASACACFNPRPPRGGRRPIAL